MVAGFKGLLPSTSSCCDNNGLLVDAVRLTKKGRAQRRI
ncbi:hypothetical protein ACNSO8_12215 [Yersinia sp. LJYL362]